MDVFQLIQEGKLSRYFRARKKLAHAGLISHITQRAAGKDVLFVDDNDYRSMLGLMKELSAKHKVSVFAFCLMPNHMHLLLRPTQDNLHLFFRDLFGRYAASFNKRYERKGHLFGGPFRQSVVLDDTYLLAVSLYIHLNPARAGIIADARKYRFSSCRLYVMKNPPASFVEPGFVLSMLSEHADERVDRYIELLTRGKRVDAGNVLEDEGAIARFMTLLKESCTAVLSILRSRTQGPSSLHLLESLDDRIAAFENLRSLRKPESMKAKQYLVQQLLARGYTGTQVADRLNVSRKTVYNILAYRAT